MTFTLANLAGFLWDNLAWTLVVVLSLALFLTFLWHFNVLGRFFRAIWNGIKWFAYQLYRGGRYLLLKLLGALKAVLLGALALLRDVCRWAVRAFKTRPWLSTAVLLLALFLLNMWLPEHTNSQLIADTLLAFSLLEFVLVVTYRFVTWVVWKKRHP